MSREYFKRKLSKALIKSNLNIEHNLYKMIENSSHLKQQHTNDVFTEKWAKYEASSEKERMYQFQRESYLKLYGFESEEKLENFLKSKQIILDAGCGLGYKAAWFAKLAPHALVIGIDFSDSAKQAAEVYSEIDNLFFVQGDISSTGLRSGAIDYTSCDQVIMHTENPEMAFAELARITNKDGGEFACYFYAKKALPRELLDDYFRINCLKMEKEEIWIMSKQLAQLGRSLSELNIRFECPDIPALGIKGGNYDVQRFIYWNFLKCYWNEELGIDTSIMTNFDWYSPSNARRFTREEIEHIVESNKMKVICFHTEEAAHSGRFSHKSTENSLVNTMSKRNKC